MRGPVADLAVGASRTVDCTHTALSGDVPTYRNTASVETDQTGPTDSNTLEVAVLTRPTRRSTCAPLPPTRPSPSAPPPPPTTAATTPAAPGSTPAPAPSPTATPSTPPPSAPTFTVTATDHAGKRNHRHPHLLRRRPPRPQRPHRLRVEPGRRRRDLHHERGRLRPDPAHPNTVSDNDPAWSPTAPASRSPAPATATPRSTP